MTRKVLTTVGIGGATFLVTNALKQPQATSITLSVLIGGIALLIRFLADFEKRLGVLERVENESILAMRRLVDDTFPQISEATELYRLIDSSVLERGLVTDLVRNAARISDGVPPIVHHFVEAKMRETSDLMKQIAEGGTVTYYGEDREWLLGLTRNATKGIDAISMAAVDHGLWQSEIGQRYLDAQRRVAADGKDVRRIFVLDATVPGGDPELLRVCEEQARMNIKVRLLDRAEVPAPLKIKVRDLIVFDEILAYETTPTPSTDPKLAQIAETRLVLTGSRVMECSLLFRELWDVASEPQAYMKA